MSTHTADELIVEGAPVVEIIDRPGQRPRLGTTVTVRQITPTLIITDDDRRWTITDRWPIREGRHSGRKLYSAHHPLAVALLAQAEVVALAEQARNLSVLPRTDPEQVFADLTVLYRAASEARRKALNMMTEASRATTASDR